MFGACGEEKEMAEHLILCCKGLHPAVAERETDLVKALDCKGTGGKINIGKAEIAMTGYRLLT